MKQRSPFLVFSLFFLVTFSSASILLAQSNSAYRSTTNENYWKNRKPFEGYWQQDVHYKINASLDEKTDIITGSEELVYWNNSPDELTFVYFHLYEEAFQPGSYLDELQKENDSEAKYGKYESKKLGTHIDKIIVNGQPVKTEQDNTILKIYLPNSLKSGDSLVFEIQFKTYFDSGSTVRRRMKIFNSYGYKHYDGVHWYPRITVYDRKFGWCTDQHLGKEFYGDFGTYDVVLNMANNFVLDATGILMNKEEVMPKELRDKLDIANFKDKPLEERPSVITPYDSTIRKTWIYHAENVHDFAFTADPTYRIGETSWNGIQCISLVQEPHASHWQNAAAYAANVVKVYSEDIGMYSYPKIIVADARDGMEYPMLTLDGGLDPDYRSLLAHEIGHNWFFGQVGSNETYRAMMDEGFAQFLTVWASEKLEGKQTKYGKRSSYADRFLDSSLIRNTRAYATYMNDVIRDDDNFLNTHSDDFNSALGHGGGYRSVYYKTAVMLFNLQYVLGDKLFLDAMKNYFNQWKFCHPYPEDFRNSVINYTHVDLNWFFDEWIETTKKIDYAVGHIEKSKNSYQIELKRYGKMQMPIDFDVVSKRDSVYHFHIPNQWFIKETNATILPKWYGWDKLDPTYIAHVTIPGGIKNVIIDPSGRLADANMLNNSKKLPLKFRFDSKILNSPSWTNYEFFWRPDVWYNSDDGVKVGINVNGNYWNYKHVFSLTVWGNTSLAQGTFSDLDKKENDKVSYNFSYRTAADRINKNSGVYLAAKMLDGLQSYTIGFDQGLPSIKSKFYLHFKSMVRTADSDLNYLLFPDLWQPSTYNNTINTGIEYVKNREKNKSKVNLDLKTAAFGSDYDYSLLSFSAVNNKTLWKLGLNSRLFLQYGSGENTPSESALYLAGANPEELMENKYTRARGFFDNTWLGYGENTNHFQAGGGLNLRGYAGYWSAYEDDKGYVSKVYRGNSGAAVNAELEFDQLVTLMPKFLRNYIKVNTYLFGDGGLINYNKPGDKFALSDFRADAGLGTALTIKKWGILQGIDPLTIRFDMPFFLTNVPVVDQGHFQFRWILAVKRAF